MGLAQARPNNINYLCFPISIVLYLWSTSKGIFVQVAYSGSRLRCDRTGGTHIYKYVFTDANMTQIRQTHHNVGSNSIEVAENDVFNPIKYI